MNELDRAAQFLVSKLTSDGQLNTLVGGRVCEAPAPPETPYPFITYFALSGPDTTAGGGVRVLSRPLFQVLAVEKGGAMPYAIADRMDAVLQASSGKVGTDAYVAGIVRESAVSLPEEWEGVTYRRLGGHYRVHVHAL